MGRLGAADGSSVVLLDRGYLHRNGWTLCTFFCYQLDASLSSAVSWPCRLSRGGFAVGWALGPEAVPVPCCQSSSAAVVERRFAPGIILVLKFCFLTNVSVVPNYLLLCQLVVF